MDRKTELDNIIKKILKSKDASSFTEIYVSEGSVSGDKVKDTVHMMVCYDADFKNADLSDIISDIEEEDRSFFLILSAEPDMVERGHGIVLWKRGE